MLFQFRKHQGQQRLPGTLSFLPSSFVKDCNNYLTIVVGHHAKVGRSCLGTQETRQSAQPVSRGGAALKHHSLHLRRLASASTPMALCARYVARPKLRRQSIRLALSSGRTWLLGLQTTRFLGNRRNSWKQPGSENGSRVVPNLFARDLYF